MADRHPNCIYPLCGCLGTADCQSDPMNTPLPCDVKVGHATFRKGVKLGTFVEAARRWHREAFPDGYTLTDEQKAANLARLQSVAQSITSIEEDGDTMTIRATLANHSGVALDRADRVKRLQDAIEGECDGLAVDEQHARAILEYVDGGQEDRNAS